MIEDTRDSGAIAIIVAIMAVLLMVISAFTVDFGVAYNSKRELSIAADAASLTAGRSLAAVPGSCDSVRGNALAVANAQKAADDINDLNAPGSTHGTLEVSCVAGGRTLIVRYSNTTVDDTVFGTLAGIDEITTQGRAGSAVQVASGAGLVPYAICLPDINRADIDIAGGGPIRTIYFPANANNPLTANCPTNNGGAPAGPAKGNWYTIDCPGVDNNGTGNVDLPGSLAYNTKNGCQNPINVIDVPTGEDPTGYLLEYCESIAPADESRCLGGNPGNLASDNLQEGWDYLIGKDDSVAKDIVLPVFDPNAYITDGGNNRVYPVKALVGVQVCGYRWGNDTKSGLSPDPACAGAAHPASPVKKDWLLLRFKQLIVTGGAGGNCTLGSECDLGTRYVSLVE